MKPDHYATLGVSPMSEDVVIRAAYRALIRHYHPDRNPSIEAARRTQAINAAYAVLGDAERRADYDAWRRVDGLEVQPRRSPGPVIAGSISAVAVGLLLFAILSPPGAHRQSGAVPAAPVGRAAVAGVAPAAELPSEVADRGETLEALTAAELADPPEMPVILKPAVRQAAAEPEPPSPKPAVARKRRLASRIVEAPRTAPAEAPVAALALAAKPSFDCRYASGRADRTVCRNPELALLDERMAVLYSQSWGQADESRRGRLLQSRDGFVERRNRCRSSSCLSRTYLQRMREISDIMGGQAQPR